MLLHCLNMALKMFNDMLFSPLKKIKQEVYLQAEWRVKQYDPKRVIINIYI